MFEDEKDYFEALGLEAPKDETPEEGAQSEPDGGDLLTDDTAEPEEGEDEGENEEGDAGLPPSGEGENEGEASEPPEKAGGQTPGVQSKEERARQAAQRRQQEREAYANSRVQAALAERDAQDRELLTRAGFKDGETPITSMQELRAYLERQQTERLSQDLRAGKLTPEGLQAAVSQELQRQQAAAEQAQQLQRRQQERDAFLQRVETELAEIRKYDPSIQSPADFSSLDRADAFMDAVKNHGYGFLDAYRFVYADRIAEQAAKRQAQRAVNNARSKDHMRATGGRGTGDVQVPAAVERNIRSIMPNATPKQIREFYRKDSKKFN